MNPNKHRRTDNSGKPISKATTRKRLWGLWLALFVGVIGLGAAALVFVRLNRHAPASTTPRSASLEASPNALAESKPASGTTNGASMSGANQAGHAQGESGASDAEVAVGLLTRGNELLAEKNFADAIKEYEQSLRLDPGSEDTHYNLAIALARLGRDDEAILHYKEALKILPDYAEAHNNLGNLLVKRGQFDEAVQHFNEALNLNPDSASTHNNLGTALARQGKLTDATVHFAKAIQLMPGYIDAHYNLGNAYVAQGRVDEAIGEFQEALHLQPGFAPALNALAKARQRKGR